MIKLEPYREIVASRANYGVSKIIGEIITGAQAYRAVEATSLRSLLVSVLIAFGIGYVGLLAMPTSPLRIICFCGWLIFIPLVGAGFRVRWHQGLNKTIGPPTLLVSSASPQRGQAFNVVFRQPVQQDTLFDRVTIDFIKRETVRYPPSGRQGDRSVLDTHDQPIDTASTYSTWVKADDSYEQQATFRLPADAMHNLALHSDSSDSFPTDYSLVWLIRVTVNRHDSDPLVQHYALTVVPSEV